MNVPSLNVECIKDRVMDITAQNTPGLSYYMKAKMARCDYCHSFVKCAGIPFTIDKYTFVCVVCFVTWLNESSVY